MQAILSFLCVAAILGTIIEQGNCAPKINRTPARNVTAAGSRNASRPGNPKSFLVVANRTKRVRREAVDSSHDIYQIPTQQRNSRAIMDGTDSWLQKRSLSFFGGTHKHDHSHSGQAQARARVKATDVCQSYKFLPPTEAKGKVFPAGTDIYGDTLGICRAVIGGDLTPGKYREDLGACLIPRDSKEHRLTAGFEVLTLPQPKYFSWLRLQNGQVPHHGMAWGRASDGKPKYIARCRTHMMGKDTIVPGKIHNGRMSFSFDWKEHVCDPESVQVFTCTGA